MGKIPRRKDRKSQSTGRFCGVNEREIEQESGRESAGSLESTGQKSSESPGGSRSVLWSQRDRNRARVWEGVGRFCGVDGREIEREFGRESTGSVESTGEKSRESSGGSLSRGSRSIGSLGIRVLHFTS
jgi:hypothetical protein